MATRPKTLTVANLIAGLAGASPPPGSVPIVEIHNTVIDSRQVTPGSLFIALHGERRDGHDFIPEAIARGAVAILAERAPDGAARTFTTGNLRICEFANCFCLLVPDSLAGLQQAAAYWRLQHDVTVIGITGSVGKSASKELIAAVLSRRYRTLKSEGSYNNEIGLPLTLLHLTGAHERVILEMGMYTLGEITALAGIARPRIGVVTNVGPTHLERLGSIERIAQAKAELPQALPPAAEGGIAILNADDERVQAMASQTQARVFTYGLDSKADLWAGEIESEGLKGIRFRLHHGREMIHARVPLLGRHSVHTALRAAAVGLVDGLSWGEIVAGLQDESAQLRLLAVAGPGGSVLLDDTYNASPESCIAALNLLAELDGRKVAVLGDMYELGRFEEEGHKIVGRRARDVADVLVTVGELGRIIGQEALAVGLAAETVHQVETKAEAIDLLRALVRDGDKILVKGSRGMAMEEIVSALVQTPPAPHARKQGDLP
jgi:UDP-N-acetylmuramoyl-tripeptide--D-alanyl-D-alanine ligase